MVCLLKCVLYGVTRGESIDAACKLARGATGRPVLVTVDGGYYGDTGFAFTPYYKRRNRIYHPGNINFNK
jgi:4-aminobutyrate aminotransferase-like enzyme